MTQEELQKTVSTLADGTPVQHAGTLDDPIPQQLLYAKTGKDGVKKIYTVAAGVTIAGGGVITNINNATDTDKGVTFLSDAIDSDAAAADGFTAATPKAVKTALEEAKTYANNKTVGDATDTVKGIVTLTDATDDTSNAATGTKAATPLAVNKVKVELTTLTGTVNTIKNNQGELTSLTTTAQDSLVNAINEVNAKQGTGGTTVGATDTVKGISKLSDAINSDLNAATGITAATPLAVKTVDVKIGDLSNLNTKDKSNVVNAINEVKANSSSSGNNYVVTPIIITPTNGTVGQSTRINIVGGTYKNVFPDDARKHRVFEVCKDNSFASNVIRGEVDADSWKVDQVLDPTTKYYVRIKDISTAGYESLYSTVVNFITGARTGAVSPTLTLMGYNDSPTDIGSGLKIKGSDYEINDSGESDTHKATSWSIRNSVTRANVWESLNDSTNKTQITVPKGTLQKSTKYTVSVVYHSTNFVDSAASEQDFTTSNDFGTVQAPIIEFNTDKNGLVMETPTFRGGVFSNTREPDTHAATEIKILLSRDSSVVWEKTTDSAATSITVPRGHLQVSNQYKVQLRYKGANFGWSAWSEMTFTTADEFSRYNYIGIPGTSTFGVGLAEEKDYKAVQLEPAEKCLDPTDFQYGMYTRGSDTIDKDFVAMKWIPKFYIKQLQKNEGTVNLNDSELEALLPYVEVTKEQMKEAQRRSPHNALVVAPADRFTDEADANTHGFYLMHGFIDGGKEYNGFFIANTITKYTRYTSQTGSKPITTMCVHLGANIIGDVRSSSKINLLRSNSTNADASFFGQIFPYKVTSASAKKNFVRRLANTPYHCCSVYAWSIISILSLIQGQYATDTNECAWYDSTLVTNFPKGVNSSGTKDINDASVTITPVVNDTQGNVFVTKDAYTKTTHNGSITGITNVNGWLYQYLIGSWGDGSKMLKRSASIYDITYDNVDSSSASYYETKNISRISGEWGGSKSSLPDLAGDDKDFFGIYAFGGNTSRNSNEFGMDNHSRHSSYSAVRVGGYWNDGDNAGVFHRNCYHWTNSYSGYGFRAMAYPRTV